jgi:hypothetical protein
MPRSNLSPPFGLDTLQHADVAKDDVERVTAVDSAKEFIGLSLDLDVMIGQRFFERACDLILRVRHEDMTAPSTPVTFFRDGPAFGRNPRPRFMWS